MVEVVSKLPAKKMPNPPKKLATPEDVSRYLTTVTRMLHDDLVTPQKATALRNLCIAKLTSLKENTSKQTNVQINIGSVMGNPGKKAKDTGVTIRGADGSKIEVTTSDSFDELEANINEVLNDSK